MWVSQWTKYVSNEFQMRLNDSENTQTKASSFDVTWEIGEVKNNFHKTQLDRFDVGENENVMMFPVTTVTFLEMFWVLGSELAICSYLHIFYFLPLWTPSSVYQRGICYLSVYFCFIFLWEGGASKKQDTSVAWWTEAIVEHFSGSWDYIEAALRIYWSDTHSEVA